MDVKRRLIFIVAILLVAASFVYLFTACFLVPSLIHITGETTAATQGDATLCLGRPPTINSISTQLATVDQAFSYQVNATFYGANTNISYFDNTTLFDINQSGYISFTPGAGSDGLHSIKITVQDSSDCLFMNTSETFLLIIFPIVTPSTPAPSGGGGGGGGTALIPVISEKGKLFNLSFQLSDEIIKVSLKESQKSEKEISIINDGKETLKMVVVSPLSTVLSIQPNKFNLHKDKEQKINLSFNPYLNATPGVYYSLITVTGEKNPQTVSRTIPIVVEIESEKVIFDASLDLIKKSYNSGDGLKATISLFNLGDDISANVTLIHTILDLNNNVVYQEEETVTMQQASFSKTIPLLNITPGQYLYALKVIYKDSFATATEFFTVEESKTSLVGLAASATKRAVYSFGLPLMLILITAIVIVLYLIHKRIRKIKELKARIKSHKSVEKRLTPL
ncbi:MAG: hypothetical protein KJ984_01420 [Nanoarchaeota archaeon]|nr:hypothetical protein [Nanoarchaeota archaeon]